MIVDQVRSNRYDCRSHLDTVIRIQEFVCTFFNTVKMFCMCPVELSLTAM